MEQCTSCVFMVRPLHFGFNEQTALSNSFQNKVSDADLLLKVQQQFDGVVKILRDHDIEVFVFEDRPEVVTPDSIFPNNWICINNNSISLFPMLTANRQTERRQDIISFLSGRMNPQKNLIDLTEFENQNKYLEGTGSMVLDHANRIAYACLSPRTDVEVFNQWCQALNYKPITFSAFDKNSQPIYHINVIMTIGTGYAVIAGETITDTIEREVVESSLISTNHELIFISYEQVLFFAGNMLEVKNKSGKKFLLMSDTAYKSLSLSQIDKLRKYCEPLVFIIPSIEETGGGSIRCMIAEVFF